MFGSIKIYIFVGIAILIACLCGALYILNRQNGLLNEEIGKQKVIVDTLNETVKTMQSDALKTKENTEELINNTNKLRTEIDKQRKALLNHNLGKLGSKKPRLLEKKVNNSTQQLLKRLEKLSRE